LTLLREHIVHSAHVANPQRTQKAVDDGARLARSADAARTSRRRRHSAKRQRCNRRCNQPAARHGESVGAAARDLALFVRSGRMQQIRKLTGNALLAAIRREYGNNVSVLSGPTESAPPGTVAVWTAGTHTVFSERSEAAVRFYVELDGGKITKQNLRGLALVF
jgi:hypothetical protein